MVRITVMVGGCEVEIMTVGEASLRIMLSLSRGPNNPNYSKN